MWMCGQHHNLAAVLLCRIGKICVGGRVGPRPGLDGCANSRPPLGYAVHTVHPLERRCTNCYNKD